MIERFPRMCPQHFQKYEQKSRHFRSHRNNSPDTGYPDGEFFVFFLSLSRLTLGY